MITSLITNIEKEISHLPNEQQLTLLRQIEARVRRRLEEKQDDSEIDALLAEMAADPNIQRENREINSEFSVTESDGLKDE